MSEEDKVALAASHICLFPPDIFGKFLPKVLRELELSNAPKPKKNSDNDFQTGAAKSIPKMVTPSAGIPLPAIFYDIIKRNIPLSKIYSLMPDADKKFRLPIADEPVSSPCSSSVLLMEADGFQGTPVTGEWNKPYERTLRLQSTPSEQPRQAPFSQGLPTCGHQT